MKKRVMIVTIVFLSIGLIACEGIESNTGVDYAETQIEVNEEVDEPVTLNDQGIYVSKYASISKVEWETINPTKTKYSTAQEFLIDVDYHVEQITSELGRETWLDQMLSQDDESNRRIQFKFTTEELSRAYGGGASNNEKFVGPVVLLNIKLFEYGHIVITHELTHIISTYTESWSLSEGLACYMQNKVSLNNGQFAYKGDFSDIIEMIFEQGHDYLCDYLGSVENGKNNLFTSDNLELKSYYALSLSFTDYVVDRYGFDKFMDLYISDCSEKSYIDIFGINREELIREFKESITPES